LLNLINLNAKKIIEANKIVIETVRTGLKQEQLRAFAGQTHSGNNICEYPKLTTIIINIKEQAIIIIEGIIIVEEVISFIFYTPPKL